MKRFSLCALAMFAAVAHAQFTPSKAMDSTLAGIKTVYFTPNGSALDSAVAHDFALELRKAGIRIASDGESADAQIFLSVTRVERAMSTDGTVTVEVHQPIVLARTQRRVQIPTWILQSVGRNVVWSNWSGPAVRAVRDDFLNRWLSANGR